MRQFAKLIGVAAIAGSAALSMSAPRPGGARVGVVQATAATAPAPATAPAWVICSATCWATVGVTST